MPDQKKAKLNVVAMLTTLIAIWAMSLATVFLLKGWGPVEAVFEYAGEGAVLKAGSFLGAVIVVFLVLLYGVGKLAEIFKLTAVAQLARLNLLFRGE